MALSHKQLNRIARLILAQEEESDGSPWRDDTEGELLLYADNTSEIYPMKQQIIKNMKKKIEKGVYDPEAAVKGWMYWVDSAAKMYAKEFLTEPYHQIFTKDVRMNVAQEVAEREYEMIVNGEYDERTARKINSYNFREEAILDSFMTIKTLVNKGLLLVDSNDLIDTTEENYSEAEKILEQIYDTASFAKKDHDSSYFDNATWTVVLESNEGDNVVYEGDDFKESEKVMRHFIDLSLSGELPNTDVKWYKDGEDVGGGNLLR